VDTAGHEFFAGTGLAVDQAIDARIGDLRNDVEHLAHGRAGADHVVEHVRPLGAPTQQRVFRLGAAVAEHPIDGDGKLVVVQRRHEEVDVPQLQRGDGVLRRRLAADDHRRKIGVLGTGRGYQG